MSGHTGKMTREAIAARGPRMCLYKVFSPTREHSMLVIGRYGASPFTDKAVAISHNRFNFVQLARSYSLSYLMRVAFGNLNLSPEPETRMGINS